MNCDRSPSTDLVAPRRKGSKQVTSAPVDRIEHDDTMPVWWGAPVVPACMILNGGSAFQCQKGLQVTSDLAVPSD